MNDTVKVGDYVYLMENFGFDFSKKYKVAYIKNKYNVIVENPNGWSPSMRDIDCFSLNPGKKYWYAFKWLFCSHEFIIDNE